MRNINYLSPPAGIFDVELGTSTQMATLHTGWLLRLEYFLTIVLTKSYPEIGLTPRNKQGTAKTSF